MIWFFAALLIVFSVNWEDATCQTNDNDETIQSAGNGLIKASHGHNANETCSDKSHRKRKPSMGYRVILGRTARPGQFPFMAMCSFDSNYCGGSIISPHYILTAAHCAWPAYAWRGYCRVGHIIADRGTKVLLYRVIKHPEYKSSNLRNDLALLRLRKTLTLIPGRVRPIHLRKEFLSAHNRVTVMGWGSKSWPDHSWGNLLSNNKLQYLRGYVFNRHTCNWTMMKIDDRWPVDRKHICVKSRYGGLCLGDSGGPIVHKGQLVGVFSWLEPCALGYPDVGQRISYYYRWIKKYTDLPFDFPGY